MANKLYVGNLPYAWTNEQLKDLFEEMVGKETVTEAVVIPDRERRDEGLNKGFGFVTLVDDATALSAIDIMNGHEVEGRALQVNEARPQAPRSDFGGGASRGGSGGGYAGGSRGGNGGGGRRY